MGPKFGPQPVGELAHGGRLLLRAAVEKVEIGLLAEAGEGVERVKGALLGARLQPHVQLQRVELLPQRHVG